MERQNKGENQAGQIFTAERHGIEVGEVDRRLGLPDFITVGWSTTWVAAMFDKPTCGMNLEMEQAVRSRKSEVLAGLRIEPGKWGQSDILTEGNGTM